MKRAVIKANKAFAMGVAENDVLPQQPPQRGESAGESLRALRDTRAKIHVDLGPKIKASWVTLQFAIMQASFCLLTVVRLPVRLFMLSVATRVAVQPTSWLPWYKRKGSAW